MAAQSKESEAGSPMTVDELLADLRDRWQEIENSYCAAYESLGRKVFPNRKKLDCWPVEEALGEIDKRHTTQHDLSALIEEIERARDKAKGERP